MRLRTLDRYTVTSILKTGIATALLASFMLLGVDLFSNLDLYMNHNVEFAKAFAVTILYFPEAFLLAMGPSFLFAVTYQLSMLHAHNEVMSVLNSGVSLSRIVRPIIILAVLLSAFYFFFNEKVAIPSSNEKARQRESITKDSDSTNNQDIALSDMQSGYMVYAAIYSDSDQSLFDVSLIESDAHGALIRRTDAYRAVYNRETGLWTFFDAYVYTPTSTGVSVEHVGDFENTVLLLEPQLFRNVSNEISTMSLDLAKAYLDRMKVLNPEEYASLGTEYYKRIFSCLTPMIMIMIACSLNYRFKRNVLFFSLVCSICIAVVYFVVQMMTVMLSDQGVIAPQWGTLIPFIVIIVLTTLMGAFLRRQ